MSALHMEMMEEGVLSPNIKPSTPSKNIKLSDDIHGDDDGDLKMNKQSLMEKWGLLVLYCIFAAVGFIGGPLLLRVYFLHGGSRKWLSSALQTAGFPILLLPLAFLYAKRDKAAPQTNFFASPKLLLSSIFIGILLRVSNFMYSYGLSFLPVSTSSILLSTNLIFTALFALILVRQKFSPFSINAIVIMTLGSVLLGVGQNGDRPVGVTSLQYLLGFILSIGAAASGGLALPCIEVAYTKANQVMTYPILRFSSIIGMAVNKDFQAMQREADEFGLGKMEYYLVLVSKCSSLLAQCYFLSQKSLTVIVFHEKFTGEKGMALAMSVWGFLSYFYGTYKESKVQTQIDGTKTSPSE
ncbi:hypothetical protein MKW92_017220 [Papaver armeniacum]|nr:hypothetical protein MKW92_017220 [Papaver armeniacum]